MRRGRRRNFARILAGKEQRLLALINARPDATLAELRAALPTTAALSTLWLEIDRLGLTVKKTVHADEQRRPDVAAARRQWWDTRALHDAARYRSRLSWGDGKQDCATSCRDELE